MVRADLALSERHTDPDPADSTIVCRVTLPVRARRLAPRTVTS